MTPRERFDAMVRRQGDHWLWRGRTKQRFGWFRIGSTGSKVVMSNRAAWLLYRGKIPKGHGVVPRCDVAGCVNPDHLAAVPLVDLQRASLANREPLRGSELPAAKLDESDVAFIRKQLARGVTQQKLADAFGVAKVTISLISRRLTWTHVPVAP